MQLFMRMGIYLLLFLIRCSTNFKVPPGSLDPRTYKNLYYIESSTLLCKSTNNPIYKNMHPEIQMKKEKNCSFHQMKNSDLFFLKCGDDRETVLYTLEIGSCFEAISSYKRDFTRDLK